MRRLALLQELQPLSVSSPEFTLPSFAKINWSLRVLGKRPDGYHEVSTVLQTVSLHDDLHFVASDQARVTLNCDYPAVPTDETNLIVRAARLLIDRYQVSIGAIIHLDKRIPPRGGLGGASSNAAVTLLGLAQLWQLDLSLFELVTIASELGADVPFFLLGGRVLGTGIGTTLTQVSDGAQLSLITVTPNASVSTPDAYAALKASALTTPNSAPILTNSRAEPFSSESDQWPLHNDFEKVIFEIEPEIKRVQKALLDAGARGVLLAGSGSSVFGIFDSPEAQGRALAEMQTEVGWRTFPCNTLSRSEYLRAMGACGAPLANVRFDSGA